MPKYSNQVIVQANPDSTIITGSNRLTSSSGLNTTTIELPVAGRLAYQLKMKMLASALSVLDSRSRLYVRGHGNWSRQTVGGVDPITWANTLVDAGLRPVKIISICACQAGRDMGTADNNRVRDSADSFASRFHQALGDRGVRVLLYARVFKVTVSLNGTKKTSDRVWNTVGGTKTKVGGGLVSHRDRSKMLFSWLNGLQTRHWVDYSEDDPELWTPVDDSETLAGVAGMFG